MVASLLFVASVAMAVAVSTAADTPDPASTSTTPVVQGTAGPAPPPGCSSSMPALPASSSTLSSLPRDLIEQIMQPLPLTSAAALSATDRRLHAAIHRHLDQALTRAVLRPDDPLRVDLTLPEKLLSFCTQLEKLGLDDVDGALLATVTDADLVDLFDRVFVFQARITPPSVLIAAVGRAWPRAGRLFELLSVCAAQNPALLDQFFFPLLQHDWRPALLRLLRQLQFPADVVDSVPDQLPVARSQSFIVDLFVRARRPHLLWDRDVVLALIRIGVRLNVVAVLEHVLVPEADLAAVLPLYGLVRPYRQLTSSEVAPNWPPLLFGLRALEAGPMQENVDRFWRQPLVRGYVGANLDLMAELVASLHYCRMLVELRCPFVFDLLTRPLNDDGDTILHRACRDGKWGLLCFLTLHRRGDVHDWFPDLELDLNVRDRFGRRPVHYLPWTIRYATSVPMYRLLLQAEQPPATLSVAVLNHQLGRYPSQREVDLDYARAQFAALLPDGDAPSSAPPPVSQAKLDAGRRVLGLLQRHKRACCGRKLQHFRLGEVIRCACSFVSEIGNIADLADGDTALHYAFQLEDSAWVVELLTVPLLNVHLRNRHGHVPFAYLTRTTLFALLAEWRCRNRVRQAQVVQELVQSDPAAFVRIVRDQIGTMSASELELLGRHVHLLDLALNALPPAVTSA